MATRNGKYGVVGLSDNWTGTSVEDAEVAIAMDSQVIWGEIASRSPEFNDKVASFAAPAMVLPLTKVSVRSPSKPPEPRHWSPTQQEVDETLRLTDNLGNCHNYQGPVVPYAARNKIVESESVVTCH
jgi:hypothetical protein